MPSFGNGSKIALIPKLIEEYDLVNRSFTTVWADGKIWGVQNFRALTKLLIYLHVPTRNDSVLWGGLSTKIEVKINSGNWNFLGHNGYGSSMALNAGMVSHYSNSFLYDPQQSQNYSIQFKFLHKSYNGNGNVNRNTAVIGEKFFSHLRIQEVFV